MVAVQDQAACIKVMGRANFTLSLDLKKLVNELWDRNCSRFIFDLTECVTMDSTFLGVLSGIGLKFQAAKIGNSNRSIELFNPHPRITEVLDTLGVAYLFKISDGSDMVAQQFQPLQPASDASRADVTRTCLEAHQTLMNINPQNVQKFKDVAQFLTEDLKRLEGGESKKQQGA
jgi:anti-anti-sigma regulatory factor